MYNLLDDHAEHESPQAQKELRPFLDGGEHLVWSGRPPQGVRFTKKDWILIPFSLLWGGFSIFWEFTAIFMGAPFFFALFGLPFVLVGLYLIFGRFYVDARLRRNTYYGLTAERIIILSGIMSPKIQSYYLDNLPNIELVEGTDGMGTVSFIDRHASNQNTNSLHTAGRQLEEVPNARGVYNQIRELQSEKRG